MIKMRKRSQLLLLLGVGAVLLTVQSALALKVIVHALKKDKIVEDGSKKREDRP